MAQVNQKIKIAFFDTHKFEKPFYQLENKKHQFEMSFFEVRLKNETVDLAKDCSVVCIFVNDHGDEEVLRKLSENGTKLLALRSAGFNHVDLQAAKKYNIKIVRVPEYSPYAVAEHALTLIQTLNRKTHKAYNRIREGNFSLDGLVGFDLHGKTIGIIGTGKIGKVMVKIMKGFGCQILAYDLKPDEQFAKEVGFKYSGLNEIYEKSDIISLHVPLTPTTKHMINEDTFKKMKSGVMLINTGRGALVETEALIKNLKSGHIGAAGLDVYEEEEGIFFEDLSSCILQDDLLARLMTFPNVLLTSHQAFLTHEALTNIAQTTMQNISDFVEGRGLRNEVLG